MRRGHFGPRLAGCLVVLLAPMLMGAQDLRSDFDYRVLATHNYERAQTGVPPLRWNAALAASAEKWAAHLASTGRFEHAPENPDAPEGENLWAGTKGRFSPEAMTAAWIREKKYFRPGLFPDNSTTGRVEDVGHYTQLVWRDTTHVGCAVETRGDRSVLACRYAPPGNIDGRMAY